MWPRCSRIAKPAKRRFWRRWRTVRGQFPDLVDAIYTGLAPNLRGAAGLSVLAHLDELRERAVVRVEPGTGEAVYSRT